MTLIGTVELVESNRTVRRLVGQALAKEINQVLYTQKGILEVNVRRLLEGRFTNSFEYKSLTAARGASPPGGLRAEFGLSSPHAKLLAIIHRWIESVRVTVFPMIATPDGFRGGLLLTAIQANFEDVMSLDEAIQISKGGNIPWLEWMLTRAGQAVVDGYNILIKPSIKASRSGNAIMVERPRQYHVPDKPFAGTITDNWVTRIVEDIRPDVEILIARMLR